MVNAIDIENAAQRIGHSIYQTEVLYERQLSTTSGAEVYLKLENRQISGSFKARGAFNKILSIPPLQRQESYFVAASTGNHAVAFATALKNLDLKGMVFLPQNVSTSKLEMIKSLQIPIELVGQNSLHAEIHARRLAEVNGYVLVHPYNDPDIIAGQGTIGLELIQHLPDLDVVIVPVGGGGLIAGIATYLKETSPKIQIIGCQPVNSPEMVRSIQRGEIISEDISQPTLSDGTAGGMEADAITFSIAQNYVDEWALITEEEMSNEIFYMVQNHQMIIEGSAALSLAFFRRELHRFRGKTVAMIICGKRLSLDKLRQIIC